MKKKEKFAKQWMPAMKKLLALFATSMLMCVTALSQERTVTGTVKDASGTGLPGVNVIVKGSSNGVITDLDGKFSIKVPGDNAVLQVSFIGYKTEEVSVGQQNSFAVTLNEDVKQMDEVVVVGYGVQKKKLVTGATVQVKSEDLTKNNVTRIESALQGLTPGMSIVKQSGQPGSNYNITIRGLGSVNGSEPLVLIDGVPGSMSSVNPSDIETVD
ncbi:MAG TPA: carboxypeptidase-like regulatory domain-containing protein, partial [Bacteroidales bacterium]